VEPKLNILQIELKQQKLLKMEVTLQGAAIIKNLKAGMNTKRTE
jgi:hypothetical protein